jgi:membrane protein DedA with SNARE-associated domain
VAGDDPRLPGGTLLMGHVSAVLLQWVQAHGMGGVYLFMVVENVAIPFPTELGFITAQAMVAGRLVPFWYAWAVIVAGHLSGSAVTYYAGRKGDNVLVRRFGHSRTMMHVREKMQIWYGKYGALAVLFGRLVGQVRPWASLAAGMGGVRQGTFWLWTTVGSMLYAALAMWVTKVGWEWTVKYPQWRVPAIIVMLIVFYGVAGTGLTVKWWQRRQRRRARQKGASEQPPEEKDAAEEAGAE